ncbi:hypothetical protein HanPI659440_Chr01g0022291 [Helianthus annuus]|nr:hypothetical protein HanPI659440_Chr01g0022291 [Helianthus annuus]
MGRKLKTLAALKEEGTVLWREEQYDLKRSGNSETFPVYRALAEGY